MNKETGKRAKEAAALSGLRDDQIDLADVPEVREWSGAVVAAGFLVHPFSLAKAYLVI